ncbi:MAG: hypothetical protein U5K43_08820 [Halofilum sp. (in: g-proteobacteria)]|nr:hypothetical protein [Halofilum sp. (in: g-proteobacteria)]
MSVVQRRVTAAVRRGRSIPWYRRVPELPVAGFGFLLHFAWEMLQIPWFAGMLEVSHGTVVWLCIRATGGDLVILLAGFWFASVVARRRDWLMEGARLPAALVVAVGVTVTVVFEWLATGPLDRWAYADTMPVVPVVGIGLAPLVQWLVLPPLILWLARRHILGNGVLRQAS